MINTITDLSNILQYIYSKLYQTYIPEVMYIQQKILKTYHKTVQMYIHHKIALSKLVHIKGIVILTVYFK